MKTKIHFSLLVFLFFYFAGAGIVLSQSTSKGTLIGRIIGSDTKKALPYATVMIVGTNNGAAADAEGNYIIRNVEAGKQKIKVSYVGYETKNVDVVIKPDVITELNVTLKATGVKGKEVVVTAQRVGQEAAINEQINSVNIKNVVAADRLQQNPDLNVAEAIGRLPGISLIRSGGEGTGIVIRGMNPQYSTVTLNGIELPSNSASDRSTSITGISQFLLQKVEVYKTITPDMDGDATAGSINLTLSTAPDSLHYGLLAQGGYNHLNDYWGNYRFVGDVSDRLFNKKLGVRLDVDVEKVNRSTQTMGASYSVQSNINGGLSNEQVFLDGVNLNAVTDIPSTESGTLVLDYSFSPSSKVFFYNLFSQHYDQGVNVTKTIGGLDGGLADLAVSQNNSTDLLYSGSIRVEHALSWVNIDYGAAFSSTHSYQKPTRSWTFRPWGITPLPVTGQDKLLTPQQLVKAISVNITPDSLVANTILTSLSYNSYDQFQENITPYFDLKVPFNFGKSISGYIKGGGKYNYINRKGNYINATNIIDRTVINEVVSAEGLSWAKLNSTGITAAGLLDHEVSDFLDGQFNFGWYPKMDRLNQLWEAWNNYGNAALSKGTREANSRITGFIPDILGSSINDQSLDEKYIGGYLMSEIDLSDLIMLLPGVRYEKVTDNLTGHQVTATASTYGLSIPGTLVNAQHNDEFWLPMIHLQVKPSDWMNINLSYTNTLYRPPFNSLTPNTYTNSTFGSYVYDIGNPYLKPELWTNYDLQVVCYSNEIGLISAEGFYKKVKNKIWQRSYLRLPSDSPIPGFPDNVNVSVSEWENHQDPGYVKGVGFEWQTNFWYLPTPLNYFSLDINYTVLKSTQQYPTTRLWTTYEYDSQGRPHPTLHRADSSITDRMLNQPNSIANVSFGFNYRGFGAWLSFQYNGSTLTGWTSQRELIPYRKSFYKWDFQAVQKLPLKDMEVLLDVANISNYQQSSTMIGDVRPTYIESYGWTSDLGLRYNF